MSERCFFSVESDGRIVMRCRVEGDGGIVGDAFREIAPGDETGIAGLTYADLLKAAGGVLTVTGDGYSLEKGTATPPRRRRG